ncbi:MAG: 2-hydroxychromene-2-carboxylate isomerase [Steroidobacteraceae bacterium]
MNIEFWFEFGSTYSYPAAMRIEALAAERGLLVTWRAFLLGPIFREQGWRDSPFNLYPAKGRYMWRDLERTCEHQGIPFRRPTVFPRSGLLAARIACRYSQAEWLPEFVRNIYRANFAEDLDISLPETVADCLIALGQDPEPILNETQTPDAKTLLRTQTEEASRRAIFGAPSFLVGSELFWGNDRLEEALSWAVT